MEITRGDYKKFKFQRKNKNNEVITEIPEKIFFTVKQNNYETNYLFQKRLNDGIEYTLDDHYYRIEILEQDTEKLAYGDYVYDIEIIVDGKTKTIKKDTIKITEETTHKANEV